MADLTPTHTTIPTWTIGDRLAKARKLTGLSRADFAEEIGISHNSVINYEECRTRPRKVVLRAWALRTGVPIEWLERGVIDAGDTVGGTSLKRSRPAPRREVA